MTAQEFLRSHFGIPPTIPTGFNSPEIFIIRCTWGYSMYCRIGDEIHVWIVKYSLKILRTQFY